MVENSRRIVHKRIIYSKYAINMSPFKIYKKLKHFNHHIKKKIKNIKTQIISFIFVFSFT
ncbi:hypothetical protein HMPREF9069_01523 [Atopobium sp. oral taxon 810 str. F0209]|nr:hypothetical protein HMPREF9069_01523 [Atopobium sp. oral taxon 810 str. F0209]